MLKNKGYNYSNLLLPSHIFHILLLHVLLRLFASTVSAREHTVRWCATARSANASLWLETCHAGNVDTMETGNH